MKKIILAVVSAIGMGCSLPASLEAQEVLSLTQCREMALKYNKEKVAARKQSEAARLMSLVYKANFFPSFTASGNLQYVRRCAEHSGGQSSGVSSQPGYRGDDARRIRLFSRCQFEL